MVIQLKDHPTIDEVYAEIQKKYPSISKTTVYRNLRQLAKEGVMCEVSLPDGLERYDVRTDQHYHFECRNCGNIFDIDIGYLADMDNDVRKKYDFDVDKHFVIFTGLCPKCKGNLHKKNGSKRMASGETKTE